VILYDTGILYIYFSAPQHILTEFHDRFQAKHVEGDGRSIHFDQTYKLSFT